MTDKRRISEIRSRVEKNEPVTRSMVIHLLEQLDKARAEIKHLKATHGWIPVEERLPEQLKAVLVLCENGKIGISGVNSIDYPVEWCTWTGSTFTPVTHWMPLPEPPKEG